MILLAGSKPAFDPSNFLVLVVPLMIFTPLLMFAVILSTFRTRRPALNSVFLGAVLSLAFAVFAAVALVPKSSPYKAAYQWINLPLAFNGPQQFQGFGIDVALRLDHAGLIAAIALTSMLIGSLAWSRVGARAEPGLVRLYALASLCLAAGIGVILSGDLAELFAFWGVAAICTYLMLSNRWAVDEPNQAGQLSLALPALTDFGLLAAIALLYSRYGRVDMDGMFPVLHSIQGWGFKSLTAAAILIFAGAAGRAALVPMHFWQTRATAAPAFVSAFTQGMWLALGGVLVYRTLPIFKAAGPQALAVMTVAGLVAAFIAAIAALVAMDSRRTVTLAGCAQAGLVFVLLAQGAAAAAFLAIIATALARTAMVLASGSITNAMRSGDMAEQAEGFRRLRWSSLGLLLSWLALGVAVIPGLVYPLRWTVIAPLAAVALALLMLGAGRPLVYAGWGVLHRRRAFEPARVREVARSMFLPALVIALAALAVGSAGFVPQGIFFINRSRQPNLQWPVAAFAPAGLVAAVVVAFVIFGRRQQTQGLSRRVESGWTLLWNRATAAYGRLLAPGYWLLDRFERTALGRGEAVLAGSLDTAGRLAASRVPALGWLLIALAVAAVAFAALAPSLTQ